jgi:flagellar biogenesis protein FliO
VRRELRMRRVAGLLMCCVSAGVAVALPPAHMGPHGSPATEADPWAAVEPRGDEQRVVRRAGVSDVQQSAPAQRSWMSGGSWMRTVASLLGVLGLIVLLGWGYRAAIGAPLALARSRHPGLLDVISRVGIGPRQSLCLVRFGSRLVLVGVSAERLSALDVVSDPELAARLAGASGVTRDGPDARDFDAALREEAQRLDAPAAEPPLSAARRALETIGARLRSPAAR